MLKNKMLKIIHRTILKELSYTFVLSLISLNFVLMMEKVMRLSRILSGVGASIADMGRIILFLQPQLMILTIPMSLLLATLLTYGRLNADNELTILRTAGMSFRDISTPVFVLGVIGFFFELAVSFSIGPSSAIRVRDSLSEIIMQRAPMAIEAGVFNTSFKDVTMLVRDKSSDGGMDGIFIYDNRNRKEPKMLIAKKGRIHADREYNLSIYLKDGYIHIARPEGSTEIFFKGYNLFLNLVAQNPERKYSEMTPSELIKTAKNLGRNDSIPVLLEFHRRLSLPSLCILLMFLGPPLSLLAGKSGRLGGLTIGLGVFMIFYIMLIYGENIARSGNVAHYIGAWFPVIITGIASVLTFRKAGSR